MDLNQKSQHLDSTITRHTHTHAHTHVRQTRDCAIRNNAKSLRFLPHGSTERWLLWGCNTRNISRESLVITQVKLIGLFHDCWLTSNDEKSDHRHQRPPTSSEDFSHNLKKETQGTHDRAWPPHGGAMVAMIGVTARLGFSSISQAQLHTPTFPRKHTPHAQSPNTRRVFAARVVTLRQYHWHSYTLIHTAVRRARAC